MTRKPQIEKIKSIAVLICTCIYLIGVFCIMPKVIDLLIRCIGCTTGGADSVEIVMQQ